MRMPQPDNEAGSAARQPGLPWHHRLNVTTVSLIVFLLQSAARFRHCAGRAETLITPPISLRFVKRFFPPDFSVSGQILEALVETIQIAVLATCFSILLAFPLAAAGAQTLSPRWLVVISRMLMNCIRTIPSLIWALIAVAVVGPYPLAGVLGLSF